MQAIELTASITSDHELHLRLPNDAGTGPAWVIILFEAGSVASVTGGLDDFLDHLPRNTSSGLDHETVVDRVDEERAAWGER